MIKGKKIVGLSMKKRLFYIFLAVAFSLIVNITYISLFEKESLEGLYGNDTDEANNLTAELMLMDKTLLKNDPFFPHSMYSRKVPFCYKAFWSYVSYLGKALGSLELANALINFIFSIILISGLCVLCWYLSGDPYVGILVAVFSSIPMEATGGQIYGLRYLFKPAVLNGMWNYLSPWLLFLFFKTVRSFNKFLLFFLSLALLTAFYALGASLFMLVVLTAFIIIEIKSWIKRGAFHFWKIILLAGIILISVLPVFMGYKDAFFKASAADIPIEWLRFRYAPFFYDKTLIIDKITFWLIPVIFGIFGYWLKKRQNQRWDNDGLLSALFYSVLILTIFGMAANYNIFFLRLHIDRVSVSLYLIAFLYAAYGVRSLYKKKRPIYIVLSIFIASLLIVPKGKVLVPFLRYGVEEVILPSKRMPHAIEREQKRIDAQRHKALKAPFLEMAQWVKKNTPKDSIFITPVAPLNRLPAFRYYATRPIVTNWKAGSAVIQTTGLGHRWIEAYALLEDAYKGKDEKKFIYIAKRFNADYLVMYKDSFYFNLPVVYQNEKFLIYRLIP